MLETKIMFSNDVATGKHTTKASYFYEYLLVFMREKHSEMTFFLA